MLFGEIGILNDYTGKDLEQLEQELEHLQAESKIIYDILTANMSKARLLCETRIKNKVKILKIKTNPQDFLLSQM